MTTLTKSKPSYEERVAAIRCENPERAILAAYHYLRGMNQREASELVGIADSTLHVWRYSDWWHHAEAIAEERWLEDAKRKTRGALEGHIERDATTARWAAERLLPAFRREERGQRMPGIIVVTAGENRDAWETAARVQQRALSDGEDDAIDVALEEEGSEDEGDEGEP